MFMWDTPHWFPFSSHVAGGCGFQENCSWFCEWLPFSATRCWISAFDNIHYWVGKFYVSSYAPGLSGLWWCVYHSFSSARMMWSLRVWHWQSLGLAPSKSMLSAIDGFPTPGNITDVRSWFGLVNQVAWAYSLGLVMQPFRDLLRPSSKFYWDQQLNEAFEKSKLQVVALVREGIATFDVNRITCLAPDWCKDGMGFLLLQKYCDCTNENVLICCPDGWHLVFAGSQTCTPPETRYAPIKGETAAIAWSLEKSCIFVVGSLDLIATTDHIPLVGILGDRDLSKIANPRLFKLKEKILRYWFRIQHRSGKWHHGSDAILRYPAAVVKAIFDVCIADPSEEDVLQVEDIESSVCSVTFAAIDDYGDDVGFLVTWSHSSGWSCWWGVSHGDQGSRGWFPIYTPPNCS